MVDNDEGFLTHTPPGTGLPNVFYKLKFENW